VTADNGVNNDNNGQQPNGPGTPVRSPLFTLTAGVEPALAVDGDDANGEMTIDFGFANPDLCYANTLTDNASFEYDGAANTTGTPVAVLGYSGAGTSFGAGVNALQWVGNVNGISPLSAPIDRIRVLSVGAAAKVSWVESIKARHGRRYVLLEGTNSCLELSAVGGGSWSTKLRAGGVYEFALFADTASSSPAGFLLDMGAAASIIEILSGPNQGTYQYFSATQPNWSGPLTSFASGDYNGWNEPGVTRPNWRRFTLKFGIKATATAAQLDSLSLVLAGGTDTGPIVVDDMYLCEVMPTTDFGDYPVFAAASNIVSQNLFMGTQATDGEAANPTTGLANADDNNGAAPDDEDLVFPSDIFAGVQRSVSIPVTRTSTVTDARLGMWVDWNGDGDVSDANEAITTAAVVNTGNVTVLLQPPPGSEGTRYLRLRVQSGTGNVAFSGSSAAAGEVEDYAITVLACATLNVTGPAGFPKGAVGVVFPSQTFTATGGTAPYSWTMTPAIPGLTLHPTTGVLSGTPTQSGTYNVNIQASDPTGCIGSLAISITVLNCPAEQPFAFGQNYVLWVDTGIVSAMWFRDTGGGPMPIPGANSLNYTVNQPGTYTWAGFDATGCLVTGCCAVTYSYQDFGDYLVSGTVEGVVTDIARAWATVDARLKMGSFATDADDPEVTVASAAANADDGRGVDDEDIAMPVSVAIGGTSSFVFPVTNTTGQPAYISAWIDFNNNNSIADAGEKVIDNLSVPSNATAQNLTLPFSIPLGTDYSRDHWLRFRLSSVPNPPTTGAAGSGEVEDYLLSITPPSDDFGDFTSFADASSRASTSLFMGTVATDPEIAAQKNTSATGDDLAVSDDEDALTYGTLNAGQLATINVKVTNTTGSPAYLNAWIDYNENGQADAGEQLMGERTIANSTVGGNQAITFTLPGTLQQGDVPARFRLTSVSNPGFDGYDGNGEVEDHILPITCSLVAITPATLPDGAVNATYTQALTASNGTGPYTWSVVAGTLPSGLTLNATTGVIGGIPTAAVTARAFTVKVTDSTGCEGLIDYTLTIRSLRIGNLVWVDTNPNGVFDSATESGLSGVSLDLWSVGGNGLVENGAGDDTKISTVVSGIAGAYSFTGVPPGSYYVRIPALPVFFPAVTSPSVNLDNGINNDSNAIQSASGLPVQSPKVTIGMGSEPASGIDSDDTDGDATIDFGFSESDLCYRIAGNKFDNPSFEFAGSNPAAPNGGTPLALLGYTTGTTGFGTNVNALQWLGGTNGTSLLNQPITRAVVNVTTTGSKLSWVESAKSRHGKRYLVLNGTDAGISMRASGGGAWSSALIAGNEYEVSIWADNASAASASLALKINATASIFQVLSGGAPGFYSSYTVPQSEFVGSPSSFTAGDYNGWSEALANTTLPNWRKFSWRFRVAASATAAQIDAASFVVSAGTSSGPVAVDYVSLCSMSVSSTMALCGTVWNDRNNNGVQNVGEAGLSVVPVTLKGLGADNVAYTADDPTIAGPQNTTGTGAYSFTGLLPGNYYVVMMPPAGIRRPLALQSMRITVWIKITMVCNREAGALRCAAQ
jgi:hypothetical protein